MKNHLSYIQAIAKRIEMLKNDPEDVLYAVGMEEELTKIEIEGEEGKIRDEFIIRSDASVEALASIIASFMENGDLVLILSESDFDAVTAANLGDAIVQIAMDAEDEFKIRIFLYGEDGHLTSVCKLES